MALEVPELTDLQDNLFTDLVGNINQTQSACSVSILNAFAKSFGYQLWSAYVCMDRQGYTPLDATGDRLEQFGLLCGITRLQPSRAAGFITSNSVGTIPEGKTLTRCDGVEYEVIEETTVPSDLIPVIALDVGLAGNAPNGVTLECNDAIVGIDPIFQISSGGLSGGSEIESDIRFRERIIQCTANPCRTGTVQDYNFWARQYNGVTDVQVIPLANGCGTVKICFVMQNTYLNGIPSQQDVENVQDIIDTSAPLGVKTTVCAATPVVISPEIKLLDDRSIPTRERIVETLQAVFSQALIGNFCLSDIYTAVDSVYDGCFEIISPTASLGLDACSVPVLGTVKFTI